MNALKSKIILLCLVATLPFLIACDKDADEGGDGAWWANAVNRNAVYRIYSGPNDFFDGPAIVVGEDNQTFPGESWTKIQVGQFDAQQKRGFYAWLDLSQEDRIGYRGAEIYWDWSEAKKAGASSVDDWDMREILDPPVYVPFDLNAGQTGNLSIEARYYFDGNLQDYEDVTVDVDIVFQSFNASVDVPFGTVENCIHLNLLFHEQLDGGVGDFTGELYMHPEYIVVKAVTLPGYYQAELVSSTPR